MTHELDKALRDSWAAIQRTKDVAREVGLAYGELLQAEHAIENYARRHDASRDEQASQGPEEGAKEPAPEVRRMLIRVADTAEKNRALAMHLRERLAPLLPQEKDGVNTAGVAAGEPLHTPLGQELAGLLDCLQQEQVILGELLNRIAL